MESDFYYLSFGVYVDLTLQVVRVLPGMFLHKILELYFMAGK